MMLQRSLSTSSLVKQAAAAVQAQQMQQGGKRIARPRMERATTDYVTFCLPSRQSSPQSSSLAPSAVSSGVISPGVDRKHIHFNEQVEQCIAIDTKGDDDEDDFGIGPTAADMAEEVCSFLVTHRAGFTNIRRRYTKSFCHTGETILQH